jgi:hypothetical protein
MCSFTPVAPVVYLQLPENILCGRCVTSYVTKNTLRKYEYSLKFSYTQNVRTLRASVSATSEALHTVILKYLVEDI